jgi:hypothetical protein
MKDVSALTGEIVASATSATETKILAKLISRIGQNLKTQESVARVLLVGYDPETVDYSNPALPPGMSAEKIRAGIALALAIYSPSAPIQMSGSG